MTCKEAGTCFTCLLAGLPRCPFREPLAHAWAYFRLDPEEIIQIVIEEQQARNRMVHKGKPPETA